MDGFPALRGRKLGHASAWTSPEDTVLGDVGQAPDDSTHTEAFTVVTFIETDGK